MTERRTDGMTDSRIDGFADSGLTDLPIDGLGVCGGLAGVPGVASGGLGDVGWAE